MTTTTYLVEGMTCGHCIAAVHSEVSAVPGVHDVSIELRPGHDSVVSVTSDARLDDAHVAAAIDEAGYSLKAVA